MAARKLLGRTTPRLWTPPQRKLTRATSHGYSVCDFADAIGEPLLPWQKWLAVHSMEVEAAGFYRFRVVLVLVARQSGKALDLGTEVLTSRGFVTMADIREGDEVYHPDGHRVRVAAVSEIMREHDCYRVTTTDGRSVIADGGHLWTVQDKRRHKSLGPRGTRNRWFEPVTLTTAEMAAAGVSRYATGSRTSTTSGKKYATNEYRFVLPEQQPIKSPDVPLPIHPYVLGAWLGDGHSHTAVITSADPEIIDEIRSTGQQVRKLGHPYAWGMADGAKLRLGPDASLSSRLRRLGVLNNKHVPDAYLTAGTAQREALLQGLLDTDGAISAAKGHVEFCSTSRRLANAVLYLARSLGWRATFREGRATLYGKDCGPKYRVFFTPKITDPFCPFRLPRKVARIGGADGGKGRATISIASVKPVDSRPVRCIQVESPDGLWLAGRDLVPTRNSSIKRTISLWRLYVDGAQLVLGVAQDVSLAREQWQMCIDTITGSPDLAPDLTQVRRVNGDEWLKVAEELDARGDGHLIDERELNYDDDELDESLTVDGGGRYKIAASNRKAGRGLSVDELNIDELREQRSWAAWSALSKTTMARPDAQIWCMSNAGDDESVVLNQLREAALSGRDPSIGLFEWSGEDNCELDDWDQIRQANPGLGYTVSEAAIRTAITTDPPNVFRTEVLCMKVDQLDGAIDFAAWKSLADPHGTMNAHRNRLAACLDAAPDGQHYTLSVAARLADGRPRIELARDWTSVADVRRELAAELAKVKPRAFGWFSAGPAAELASVIRPLAVKINKHPGERADGEVPEDGAITGARVSEACMEFAGLVRARGLVHAGQELLDTHVRGASKLVTGDGWRYTRRGDGHCDAAYAAAGAVKVLLAMPEVKRAKIRMIVG